MPKTSTGLWRDKITGEVVTSPPVAGHQLAVPGDEVPDAVAAKLAASQTETAVAPAALEVSSAGKAPAVGDVLAAVGTDSALAAEALAAELARPKPRKGVVEPLQRLVGDG